ncbi:hypothetical protein MFLO_13900 [Listeria floridensis FSL S10-1187]|uniref:Uncharacterized protein n=1 Tax=Listeria floridensis FSL S10-1187 TaxID=1265817 RepID=A0ABN0RCK6_9LIST|nr:hypothetical protein MFLO_13900 [Listeria floridensis FSL S10-1187]
MEEAKVQDLTKYVLDAQDGKYEIIKITAEKYPELSMAEATKFKKHSSKSGLNAARKLSDRKWG